MEVVATILAQHIRPRLQIRTCVSLRHITTRVTGRLIADEIRDIVVDGDLKSTMILRSKSQQNHVCSGRFAPVVNGCVVKLIFRVAAPQLEVLTTDAVSRETVATPKARDLKRMGIGFVQSISKVFICNFG